MKILIIGFGSIGKRHFEILSQQKEIKIIHVVTQQKIDNIMSFQSLEDVPKLNSYDYFIIASQTVKHHKQLLYICRYVKYKKILVEKPLYNKNNKMISTTNKIFTAYNLRFHPILEKLSILLKYEKIYFASIYCGQYLPMWRPSHDYRMSYSADLLQGGGVLRDLSHELDYAVWLFGDIERIEAINSKISDLEINSDDIFTAIAVSNKKIVLNITVDYISKVPMRKIIIHTQNKTIEADIIENCIVMCDANANKEEIKVNSVDRNYTYAKMHEAILSNDFERLCSFEEGRNIVSIIDNIKFEESI